jgi:hypothetical protein
VDSNANMSKEGRHGNPGIMPPDMDDLFDGTETVLGRRFSVEADAALVRPSASWGAPLKCCTLSRAKLQAAALRFSVSVTMLLADWLEALQPYSLGSSGRVDQ